MANQSGNVGPVERWVSVLAGLGLTLGALRGRGLVRRAAAGTAGLSLLARGVAGHCAMKAAAMGQSSLREGIQEQWRRVRSPMSSSSAAQIDSLDALYVAELQELHSAEALMSSLLEELLGTVRNDALERQLRGYATELRSRREDLERMLASRGANPRQHPDDAMRALADETRKMTQIYGENVRDAALIASLQRLIHYKIAGYGSVAAYAKALGSVEEAARLSDYADRDKAMDNELTELAKQFVNPRAAAQPEARPAPETRPH